MPIKTNALEKQQLQVLSEEELRLQALFVPFKEELALLKEELSRVMREINSTITDAGKRFQLQALSKEELQLREKELQLQTLLEILRQETGAENTVNGRTLLRFFKAHKLTKH